MLRITGVAMVSITARLISRTASRVTSIGRIADKTHCVRELVEATNAEARFRHGEVESKIATLAAKAYASIAHAVEEMAGCVREVVAYSDA